MRAIERGLRGLPEGSSLYQYMRVTSGFDIPRQEKYADPITQSFVDHRLDVSGEDGQLPPYRSSLVPHFRARAFEPVRCQAEGAGRRERAPDCQLQKAATILETHLSGVDRTQAAGQGSSCSSSFASSSILRSGRGTRRWSLTSAWTSRSSTAPSPGRRITSG